MKMRKDDHYEDHEDERIFFNKKEEGQIRFRESFLKGFEVV